MKLKAITQHVIFVIVCLAILAFIVSGCSHNPIVVTSGKRTNIGFDPGSLSASISWTDGLNLIEVPRENTSWELEVAEGQGLGFDPATNTLHGVRKVTRKVGPQVSGYLVKLAKASPEAASEYVRQASAMHNVDGVKLSPHLVTLPLPQSNGTGISKLRLQALKDAAARDTATETVPEGLDMTLDEWRMLKAAYIECPECLSLTDAERAALQAATGK